MNAQKRVCVIGAGAAGLCALKYVREQRMQGVAYEKCSEIGGTWVYNEDTGDAACEDDVHSSMYEGLRTNLPKEVMNFSDFHYPAEMQESYIPATEVLRYFHAYAAHFNLMPHIKLQHEIIRVRPSNGAWEVLVHDMPNDKYSKEMFDFVIVCNGRYATPSYPDIEDMHLYRGRTMHSHMFRKADAFKDTTVLVIGAGRSGMDITHHISGHAKRIYLSHHVPRPPTTDFMPNVTQKSDVRRFTATGAIFTDGSSADFDWAIFCTGYRFTVPFLSADCGLHVDDNFVYPLYKHCINISHPTMCFIGLPIYAYPIQLFDVQMRFVMRFYTGQQQLPAAADMLADTERDLADRRARGVWSKRRAHIVGDRQFAYYDELVALTGIDNVPPVIKKLSKSCANKFLYELETYRNICFRIIDAENFEQFTLTKE